MVFSLLERDTVDYIATNTINKISKGLNDFIWTYKSKLQVLSCKALDKSLVVEFIPNQFWKENVESKFLEIIKNEEDNRIWL